ncbi:class I SAM-dependent methyltransferase [Mycolicibacterium sediminis]|uniref:S-adenosyl-L-methionine-dependent methyltransferase n=1 Tax=Mycolicibacterium sediminis TaxID=1286180 RepID=A0A7I7QMF4_9MYCO|nr:class I SAM-dependent methyltransferase [Mycolicibacterium sediminis]BBY27568.1 putative S-adenosyl-L-methionine-dependent methyltransferase [Mycolicibacterium sediminis]
MARTDHDSWDLASSVGATATGVAAGRALAARGPEPLLDDPYAELLVRAVGLDAFTRMISEDADEVAADPVFNRQQMAEQVTVRTRFFDDFFLRAGAAGIRQAVILASGLDTRAYRLPWPAGTVVYEIDQPQVIEFKTRALAELGATPTADRRTVGIDLRADWSTALRKRGFNPDQPTAWSAEGLLIYLPSEAQDRLFDDITAFSAPGSTLSTEHVPDLSILADDDRMADFAQRWQRYGMADQWTDLVYQGERAQVPAYLSGAGWHVTARSTVDLYAANGFALPDHEMMTELADLTYISAVLSDPTPGR